MSKNRRSYKRKPVGSIEIGSILGMKTQEPMVEITMGAEKAQLDVASARQVAFQILGAAESALSDGALARFAADIAGTIEEKNKNVVTLLMIFRDYKKDYFSSFAPGNIINSEIGQVDA